MAEHGQKVGEVMGVTFRHFGESMASSRYRSIIPAQQLTVLGVPDGKDWLVIGKHGWNWDKETAGFSRVCFDICDDHFKGALESHYLDGCKRADLITCNSEEMRRVIASFGFDAVVIPDPHEQPERPPRVHDKLLWFGHRTNIGDVVPWVDVLPNLEIVSNLMVDGTTQWTPEEMDRAFDRAGLVIIPTGKSMAKSGNRAIESIRRGLFVVAGYLPAYADLGIYTGDIGDGVKWALSHQDEVMLRIAKSQRYIREEYSPERIGRLWKEALGV